MKHETSGAAVERIDRLLEANQNLQADKSRLTKRVAELEAQLSKAISDAGWQREFYEQQCVDNNNGWQ